MPGIDPCGEVVDVDTHRRLLTGLDPYHGQVDFALGSFPREVCRR